jgi:lipoate-protein ligase A
MTNSLFAALYVYHDDSSHSAAMNMAIDEALLLSAAVPSIRFYGWHSPALSFGYFGRFSNVATYAGERDLVRRWTGGGIVFHGDDLTYSIILPSSDPVFRESSITIYEKIHRALVDTLNGIGEPAVVAGGVDAGRTLATETTITASGDNCFANPVRADVMVDGRKVAGAAQRRTRRGLLHQGSIQGVAVTTDFAQRFARRLSANRSQFEIDKKILKPAKELVEQKYGSDSWLHKR